LGAHLREEGSLGYDGELVCFQVQTKLDTYFNRQQVPFSGVVAREQVTMIQPSIAFVNIFSFSREFSFASLNFDRRQTKKNKSRVLLNPSFL
jgi:hypothetical protein